MVKEGHDAQNAAVAIFGGVPPVLNRFSVLGI